MLHTSGLSHRTSPEYRDARVRSRAYTLPQMLENVARVPLREDPGTRFRYSASPTVLGRLIEIWSGQPLDAFMAERIFAPLGMIDTGFQVPAADRTRLAVVYASTGGGPLSPVEMEEVPLTERPALLEGSVGLVSTVPDFLRFAQMLVNHGELAGVRILSAETVEEMTRNGLPPEVLAGRRTGWGLANVSVVVDADAGGGGARLGEYRWDGSAGTEFWVDPSTGTVVVTMWQQQPANPEGLREGIVSQVRASLRN
jgi:CubicO group peptidase (beta-lactamase class C family)